MFLVVIGLLIAVIAFTVWWAVKSDDDDWDMEGDIYG